MQNKKLTIAGIVAIVVVLVLVTLSYNKELIEKGVVGGLSGSSISKTNPAGTYVAFLRAADTSGRTIMIHLNDDASRSATMTSDYQNTQPPIIDRGTWSITGRGFTISFTNKNGIALATPELLSFTINKSTVQLMNADKVTWGSEGLVLGRSPLQLPSDWTWLYTTLKDGTQIVPKKDTQFTIALSDENRINLRGDCNSMSGTFGLRENNGILFSAFASTLMYCEGSQEGVFAQDVARAISYRVSGGKLLLTLPNGTGTMTFTRATK